MKLVVDRIEGKMAVLLEEEKGFQLNVPMECLPKGTREGTWINVDFSINEEVTRSMYQKNKELLEKLKRKNA